MVTLRIHCVTDGSRSIACVTTHWISLICGDLIQRVLGRILNILYKLYIFHRKDFIFQNQRSINCGCKCSKYCNNCHFWQKKEMGGVVSCLVLPTDLYTQKRNRFFHLISLSSYIMSILATGLTIIFLVKDLLLLISLGFLYVTMTCSYMPQMIMTTHILDPLIKNCADGFQVWCWVIGWWVRESWGAIISRWSRKHSDPLIRFQLPGHAFQKCSFLCIFRFQFPSSLMLILTNLLLGIKSTPPSPRSLRGETKNQPLAQSSN